MDIAARLRQIRELKDLSQGDIEARTGLLRCYISRVENGHLTPTVETLEKLARALNVKLYELLYDGGEPPVQIPPQKHLEKQWGDSGKEARCLAKFRALLPKIEPANRVLLMFTVNKMVAAKKRR